MEKKTKNDGGPELGRPEGKHGDKENTGDPEKKGHPKNEAGKNQGHPDKWKKR